MKNSMFRRSFVLVIIVLLVETSVLPVLSGNIGRMELVNNDSGYQVNHGVNSDKSALDVQFIYNITKALSYIIFTEYDEENGEIAKGRAFGTKGEHKAAEILLENMTKLGLMAWKEQLQPLPSYPQITKKIEVLNYELQINNGTTSEIVDCAPRRAWLGPHKEPLKLNHNFSYTKLKLRRQHPSPLEDKEDYVLLRRSGDPNPPPLLLPYLFDCLHRLLPIDIGFMRWLMERIRYRHWKGYICIDRNNDTHDMWPYGKPVPIFSINRTVGEVLEKRIDDYTVDFYLNQRLDKSVVSYNVIGLLNGTDPSKTVLVCCLYDSWWCQGTADSAIGMAIVLGIAKYFKDHNITPKYNIKFIGFCGEEVGCRGSIYYEATHRNEAIIYVIDLNQLGFTQIEPRLTLDVAANNESFLEEIWQVVERTDYINRTGNVTDIEPKYTEKGHISDDWSFASKRDPSVCKTLCFLKSGDWLMHHRDGLNHTEGDVLKYFNWTDVEVTGEIILNVTKYLTVENSQEGSKDSQFFIIDLPDDPYYSAYDYIQEHYEVYIVTEGYIIYKLRGDDT